MVMRPTRLRRTGIATVAGGLLLVSGMHPLTFGGDTSSPLQILGRKVVGNLVEVTLLNPGTDVITGKVVIQVVTEGGPNLVLIPFTAWGGQKVSVVWAFPTPPGPDPRVGIIVDDGAPI